MGIKVAAGDGGAAMALAGFAGGAAKRRNDIQDQQIKDKVQKENAREERDFVTGRDEARYAHDRDMFDRRNKSQKDLLSFRSELDRADYAANLSESQRQEINSDWDAYEEARKTGEYTSDQLMEMKNQINAKHMNISPLSYAKTPEPTKDEVLSKIHYDDNGIPWVLDKDGRPGIPRGYKPPQDTEKITMADYGKMYDSIKNELTDNALENGSKVPSDSVIEAKVRQKIESYRRFISGKSDITDTASQFEIPMNSKTPPSENNIAGDRWRIN